MTTGATGATGPAGGAGRPAGAGRVFAVYTLARFAVFLALTAVLFGLGAGLVALTGHSVDGGSAEPLALAAAFVAAPLSMLASRIVLARQQAVVTSVVAGWIDGRRARTAARIAAEDAYAERLLRERQDPPPPAD